MKISKVLSDFSPNKYSDEKLEFKVNHILGQMTNHPGFPDPSPSLLTISTANKKYSVALTQQKKGGRVYTVIKNQCRKQLQLLMKQLADDVQIKSGGDATLILSTGFDIHKKRSLVGQLSQPMGISVKPGVNNGSVVICCDAVKGARFYEFAYNETPLAEKKIWQKQTSTKRKILITGLVSGGQYTFRIAGAGSNASRTWSEKLVTYVL